MWRWGASALRHPTGSPDAHRLPESTVRASATAPGRWRVVATRRHPPRCRHRQRTPTSRRRRAHPLSTAAVHRRHMQVRLTPDDAGATGPALPRARARVAGPIPPSGDRLIPTSRYQARVGVPVGEARLPRSITARVADGSGLASTAAHLADQVDVPRAPRTDRPALHRPARRGTEGTVLGRFVVTHGRVKNVADDRGRRIALAAAGATRSAVDLRDPKPAGAPSTDRGATLDFRLDR